MRTSRSPLKSIRKHCLACSDDSSKCVMWCPCDGVHSTWCHLWPFRFGLRPETARQRLLEHFRVVNLAGFGCEELKSGVAAAGALLLALWLFAPAPAAPNAPTSSTYVLIFLGFFITATLAMVNASSTLRIYIRMLRNSGRTALEMTMHLTGVVFFVFIAAASGMASIFLRQPALLILLLPVVLLGSVHLIAIVSHIHRIVRRLF